METKDLTIENLQALIDLCNSNNNLQIIKEHVTCGTPEETLLTLLYFTDYEAFPLDEFKEAALELIFHKDLSDMPLFLIPNRNYSELLGCKDPFIYYSWIPIVAQWRLTLGC